MLPEDKQDYIKRVQKMLKTVQIVSLSTVSPGSVPHNSPVFAVFDHDFNVIWASDSQARHSQNLVHTGEVFVAAFDSRGEISTGLYIEADAAVLSTEDPDFDAGYTLFAKAKKAAGAPIPPKEYFTAKEGQRLYCAVPRYLWINYTDKDSDGVVIRDQRFRVSIAALRDRVD